MAAAPRMSGDVSLKLQTIYSCKPKMSEDLKPKVVQAAAAKVKKAAKDKDDFDTMAEDKQGVRQRINSGDKYKQTKLNFKPATKKVNPFSKEEAVRPTNKCKHKWRHK